MLTFFEQQEARATFDKIVVFIQIGKRLDKHAEILDYRRQDRSHFKKIRNLTDVLAGWRRES